MEEINLTCIECPMGCSVTVKKDGKTISSVSGNGCKRGELYARAEVTCPMRVVTSTVMSSCGVPVPVKTDKPVKKSEMFAVMSKINAIRCTLPVRIGDVIYKDISDGANLVACGNDLKS